MSIGPVSGNGIPITLPTGKTIFWSVTVQAANEQYICVKDSQQNQIFSTQGASSGGGQPTQIAQGIFQAADPTGNYTVYLGTNGGSQWSKVIYDNDTLTLGATVYYGQYTFITEDSTDNDYNDTCLQINWFQSLG